MRCRCRRWRCSTPGSRSRTGAETAFTAEEARVLRGLEARRLRPLAGPPLVIDAAVLDPVRETRADDLAWMERRLGRTLPDAPIGAGLTEARAMLPLARAALPRAADLPAPARPGLSRRLWRRLRRVARA